MVDVVFEDNHLLVLAKPPNLATQPALTHSDSLEDRAKAWIKSKYQKPGNVYLHAIHRLDTPVSGIVVFAKTSKALSRLQGKMREGETKKVYQAWVEGVIAQENGRFEDWLIHGDFRALKGKEGDEGAKRCLLIYRVEKRDKEKTLVEIELKTGRYHQIRAQFAFRGYPIWGDVKYGSRIPYPALGIALHHSSFTIPHPISGELQVFNLNSAWLPASLLRSST
jgi:23S rRNA pseudouridine1911/1915/1917 synthase